jgi:6-phosphogluconolactonase
VDHAGKNVLVANYGGGSVACLPIGADGRLGEATGFHQHKGTSVDPQRQEAPHAHSINVDPANRFVFAADLGLDQVLVYRLDAAKGTLTQNDPPYAETPKGAGPRHFAFRPDGKFAYVINELNSTVTAFRYDPEKGVLHPFQNISTLPEGYKGDNYPAEVVAHPSGKFLYGSNRGQDSIAMFRIDETTGTLTSLGQELTGGKNPRNFVVDPTGAYLLAENQDSDTILVFRVDQETGKLKPTGVTIAAPMPVCVRFLPLAS